MYPLFSRVMLHLLTIHITILFHQYTCTTQKYSSTSPTKIFDIQEDAIASKQKMLSLKFDGKYNINIDSSHVDPNYAALCVITKNDNPNDVVEFLRYHYKIGIGRIYLYDTGSDNIKYTKLFENFQEFLSDGRLYYSYWNYGPPRIGFNMQLQIYNICAQSFAINHVWLGYIDTDEFIVLRRVDKKTRENEPGSQKSAHNNNSSAYHHSLVMKSQQNNGQYDKINENGKNHQKKGSQVQNIQDFLKQYEEYAGLTMNWVLFGSSGFEKHQDSALNSYTKCMLHDKIKTIVNVRYWKRGITSVHYVALQFFQPTKYAVDENFIIQKGSMNKRYPAQKIVLFHYVTKSAEDFEVKMRRGDASGHQARQMVFYNFVNHNANYTCTEGVQLYKQLFTNNQQ